MSDRRYGVYERLDTGDEWPLSSIPDALVEEAMRAAIRAGNKALGRTDFYFYEVVTRAALSVLFPGEEE